MTHFVAVDASSGWLLQLGISAARATALFAVAAAALALFRVKLTAARLFAWTGVLYAALAMPLLGWILPALSIPTPQFLQLATKPEIIEVPAKMFAPEPSAIAHAEPVHQSPTIRVINHMQIRNLPRAAKSPSTVFSFLTWATAIPVIYLAVAVFLLARLLVGFSLTRRLQKSSATVDDPFLASRAVALSSAFGLRRVPTILESDLVSVPVTVGAIQSAILLPATWREWDEVRLNAVLAHELSHVARRDAFTQHLSLLHRAIFWFSPLSWWLERHLSDLAEQASDEAALASGTDRNEYARTLLRFFETLQAAPGRVRWQGVSMAKPGQAEKRLERILAWRGAVTMSLKKSMVVAVVALAVPVVYLAAAAHPTAHAQHLVPQFGQDQAPPAAMAAPAPATPFAPAAASTDVMPPANVDLDAPAPVADSQDLAAPPAPPAKAVTPPTPEVRPAIAIAPSAPAPPATAVIAQNHSYGSGSSRGGSSFYSYNDDEDGLRFVIASGNSDSLTMSGSSQDARHVERLKKQIQGDFIWFQSDEKSYIIRDQATIDRARAFWAPQEELGKKQEELGKRQEELGRQQEALGNKMEEIQVKVPDMTKEIDALRAKIQKLGANATMEQLGDLQSEIGELQSKIGDIQAAAGEQQGKLGEEQGKLGEQQGKLAEEANRKMKTLLDEAIKNGKAQPEI